MRQPTTPNAHQPRCSFSCALILAHSQYTGVNGVKAIPAAAAAVLLGGGVRASRRGGEEGSSIGDM